MLARIAESADVFLVPVIHISTDYVFDGSKEEPYSEDDEVNPLSVYGRTKQAGEAAVRASNPQHAIIRTAWVISAARRNFLDTMLRLGAERPTVRVVDDQRGNPTYAPHLADAILAIAAQIGSANHWGTYHAAATGETTWHGFARRPIRGVRTTS